MSQLTLALRDPVQRPLDLSVIAPDRLAALSEAELVNLKAYRGNRQVNLGDLFEIAGDTSGEPEDLTIRIKGDLSTSRNLGSEMTSGSLIVEGDAGYYLGAKMKGGQITISGNAGSWTGVEMKGGMIQIQGNGGDYLAGSYRGTAIGMRGGLITVKGNVGVEAGCWMRGGIVKVEGNSGSFAGVHMSGGTVAVFGDADERLGASMTGGTVIVKGYTESILPSFQIEEVRKNAKIGDEKIPGPFYVFTGDISSEGNGKLFIGTDTNPHLKAYEKYLV